MPSVFNELAIREFKQGFDSMGSCVVFRFDKMTVEQAGALRTHIRDAGSSLNVVKNRLAVLALADCGYEVERLRGKCGVVFSPEAEAIPAAKLLEDFRKKAGGELEVEIVAGILEGELLVGEDARALADMPDRDTLRSMLLSAISGPARQLTAAVAAVGGGLARCIDQRSDGEDAASE